MDLIKDKFYGLTIGCAIGDAMGSLADLQNQDGVTDVVESPEDGYWNEGCTLMLCQAEALCKGQSLINVLSESMATGKLTSVGELSNLSQKTMSMLMLGGNDVSMLGGNDVSMSGAAAVPVECTHLTDCLPPIGAVAMYYVRNYEQGHIDAYNNSLAKGCPLCMDACKFYHAVLDLALHGGTKKQILSPSSYTNLTLHTDISSILPLDPTTMLYDDNMNGSDNVISCLRMMLHTFNATDHISDGLIQIVNNSQAPVRTGALFGQLAGSYYGLIDIKESWLDSLQSKNILTSITKSLLPKIESRNKLNDSDKQRVKRGTKTNTGNC